MTILAIDPGLHQSGFVLLAGDRVDWHGVVPNETILSEIIPLCCKAGTSLAIEEMGGQGRFVGLDELRTVRWSGRFEERWIDLAGRRDLFGTPPPCRFILRSTVKLHVLGKAAGKDTQIRQALIDRWGGKDVAIGRKKTPGPLYGISSHAWQALAVAVTTAETEETC